MKGFAPGTNAAVLDVLSEERRGEQKCARDKGDQTNNQENMPNAPDFAPFSKSVKMVPPKGKTTKMHLVEAVAARQVVYLTTAEVERFFNAIPRENSRDRLLFEMIYRHGLRRREAARIRRD